MSYYGNTNAGGGFYGGSGAGFQQQQPSDQEPFINSTFDGQQQQQQYDNSGGSYSQQQQQQPAFTTQQWQPHAVPHQPQPGLSMPMQQQQQPVSFWTPTMTTATMAAVAGGNTDAALNLVSNAGKSFLQSKTASMVPGVTTGMQLLRTYFCVDNRYVLRKMKKILFPFMSKQWNRALLNESSSSQMQQQQYSDNQQLQQQQVLYSTPHYSLPVQDESAPDLYIPVMSLITYVLLCALAHANAGPLDPKVISSMGSWCLAMQALEVLAARVCLYLLLPHSQSHVVGATANTTLPVLDLFCYTGYKYLSLCVNLLVSLCLGRVLNVMGGSRAYYAAFAYTATATAFFMLKTMANAIPLVGGPKREVMVLAFAASQFATMWIVSIATKLL
ncbi:hypothetical protein MPSEU_000234500 [Mayamaea pseudoterrestris]|nr:hypothetical protein MPSEU_000234500 [Mayamaea pseudoterrestris]